MVKRRLGFSELLGERHHRLGSGIPERRPIVDGAAAEIEGNAEFHPEHIPSLARLDLRTLGRAEVGVLERRKVRRIGEDVPFGAGDSRLNEQRQLARERVGVGSLSRLDRAENLFGFRLELWPNEQKRRLRP